MSWLAAQQDFGAKILCDNLNALAVHAASESLDPNTRARYFINRGDTFSRIKRTLGRWLLQGINALDNVASVFDELIKNLVQIKPNRSSPRNFTKKPHLSHAYFYFATFLKWLKYRLLSYISNALPHKEYDDEIAKFIYLGSGVRWPAAARI
ncbi:hypothetical protein [Candidatus Accumulibacter contiguus]|jgi:hypothetical protein|uniref:hypothetical protein n=1 Tax=Candidatus Accumulibacter contiguus TaxID=2954381 RepID=UPI002FC32C40